MKNKEKNMKAKTLQGKTFDFEGETLKIDVKQYSNGRPALQLVDEDGLPYAKLTVNIPEVDQGEEELFIKDWAENEFLANAAITSGLFEDTGKKIKTGFCETAIWIIK